MDAPWPLIAVLWAAISLAAGLWIAYRKPHVRHHINAARGLGASEWRVFWRIGLTLSAPSIAAAAALSLIGILLGRIL